MQAHTNLQTVETTLSRNIVRKLAMLHVSNKTRLGYLDPIITRFIN